MRRLSFLRAGLAACTLLACTFSIRADEPSAVFHNTIDGVVWIRNFLPDNKTTFGTGFLIDRERRLVVTNWHVTRGEETMDVFFPVRDKQGRLIDDRDYYAKNLEELKRSGSYSLGRMTASSKVKDLAVIRLENVPPSARPLKLATAEPEAGAQLNVIGNPDGRKLWRWSGGSVRGVGNHAITFDDGYRVSFRAVQFFGGIYFGNSGGPVLDDQGEVVGVVQSVNHAEGGMNATAVHVSEVKKLVGTIQSSRVFSVTNKTRTAIRSRPK